MLRAMTILVWVLGAGLARGAAPSSSAASNAQPTPANGAAKSQGAQGSAGVQGAQQNAPAQGELGSPDDAWMTAGLDEGKEAVVKDKKRHNLKGQYFRLEAGVGMVQPISFTPENGLQIEGPDPDPDDKVDESGKQRIGSIPGNDGDDARPQIELDAGVQVSLVAGYNFVEYIGVELELKMMHNRINRVRYPKSYLLDSGGNLILTPDVPKFDKETGLPVIDPETGQQIVDTGGDAIPVGEGYVDVGGDLWQIPVFINMVFQYPTPWNITPYAMIGGGLVFIYTHYDKDSAAALGLDPAQDGGVSGTVVVPGYHASGGFRWEITKEIGAQVGYEYQNTGDYTFNGELDGITWSGIETHGVKGGITFRY